MYAYILNNFKINYNVINNLKILYQLQKAARFFEIKNILPLTQYILRIQLFLYIFVEYFLSLVEFVAIKVLPLKL